MDAGDEPYDGADDRLTLSEAGLEGVIGIALTAAILVIMGLGVFFRYVLNDSLTWSEELSRYGLVYVTFIGAALAARRRTHIRVSFLEAVLPAPAARWLERFQDVVTLVFALWLGYLAVQISSILSSTRSAAMQLPMHYVYAAIAFGCGLMAIRIVSGLYRGWRR